ncbi:Uncharacterized protein ChrSV_2078 [Chromobacterium vaccinii]|nr:Uncharacterized protein ChrSW_2078 [Chromobacterium vaccinii]QND89536.1 Uncharacterized protein ChrSV_2078 [Chromobacterium vaccinii]
MRLIGKKYRHIAMMHPFISRKLNQLKLKSQHKNLRHFCD